MIPASNYTLVQSGYDPSGVLHCNMWFHRPERVDVVDVKIFQQTNTLAYYKEQRTTQKSFVTPATVPIRWDAAGTTWCRRRR